MKLTRILTAAVLIAAFSHVGIASSADKLRVVTSTSGIIFSPVYVAQQQGFF